MLSLAITCIALALVFEFVNGFHDSANTCAAPIYSGAMRYWPAVIMCAIFNGLGAAIVGTSVAMLITSVIPAALVTSHLVVAVLLGALSWNLYTWYHSYPASSSHCLLGALVGGGVAAAGVDGLNFGALEKAGIGLVTSPVFGFLVAILMVTFIHQAFRMFIQKNENRNKQQTQEARLAAKSKTLPWVVIGSSAAVSFAHGSNDGQKTMGIIMLILVSEFGYDLHNGIPWWVVLMAATTMALGTAIGGGRIIKRVGEGLSGKPMDYQEGCAAQLTTAVAVLGASHFALPVSTTHVLTSARIGAAIGNHGQASMDKETRRVIRNMFLGWVFTFPIAAIAAYLTYELLKLVF